MTYREFESRAERTERLVIRVLGGLAFLGCLALVLLGLSAAAQEAAPVVAAPSTLELLLKYLVAPGLAILGPLLVGALAKLVTYLHSREKESKLMGALAVGAELVQTYVARAEVELRPQFAKALEDGKLTAEEGAALKAKVLELLKRDMPATLFATLSEALGPAIEGWLAGKVEQAVAAQASPS